MSNPLLAETELPLFSQIKPSHIQPAIKALLKENRQTTEALLASIQEYTFENLVWPLEILDDRLDSIWGLVSHLSSVQDSPELRSVYEALLPLMSDYYSEMGQHEPLYKAFLDIKNSRQYKDLNLSQQKIIENALRDFKLSGVSLDKEKRDRIKELNSELSELENKFEKNILDATDHWTLHITDSERLKGLSPHTLAITKAAGENSQKEGWLITLDYPTYDAIMRCAEDRELRKEVYRGYQTLASNQAPTQDWDNGPLMVEILNKKQELAELLGFKDYAEYSLVTRMLKSSKEVMDFLNEMVEHIQERANKDLEEIKAFALEEFQMKEVEAWDLRYLSESLREKRFSISEEDCRLYFSEKNVLEGLFTIAKELYGISIQEIRNFEGWHEGVKLFEVRDENNQLRGKFYIDLYARVHKRKGAWCGSCKTRAKKINGEIISPIAYIICNFRAKTEDEAEGLLSHDEVITLFHEFGHCLHDILTKVDYPSISGGNGVSWDAIELPSQLMEHWCWEKEAVDLISKHQTTGVCLPETLFLRLKKSKNFQIGLGLMRQLEFSLFDFELHLQRDIKEYSDIQAILDKVRVKTALIPPPTFNRFQNSFTHIFSGGYAAGYYSYLWSEVLSEDAYELFKRKREVFDQEVAKRFLKDILEQGGSREFMDLFVEFRGRKPDVKALLKSLDL